MDQGNVRDVLIRALKPLPYWIGYKHEKYWGHELPEAAMVAELRETLFAAVDRGQSVCCEVSYEVLRLKPETAARRIRRAVGRPEQADLVIADQKKRPIAVIEVKRGHSIDKLGKEDLESLRRIRWLFRGKLRAYFVLFSQAKKPTKLLNESGTAKRTFAIKGFRGKLAIRRVLRSVGYASTKGAERRQQRASAKSKSQHWAVLIEVL